VLAAVAEGLVVPLAGRPTLRPALAPLASLPSMMFDVPPEFLTASQAFATATDSSPALDFSTLLSVVLMIGVGVAVTGKTAADGDADVEQPAADKKPKKKAMEFGWIHADHRVPLPNLAELASGCHMVGQWNGREMYLCREGVFADPGECKPNADFTAYYGEEVFVCQVRLPSRTINVPMPVKSLPADKPKIVFHAAMMSIQNFGFFMMYLAAWALQPPSDVCSETRFASGFMSMSCFLVAFLCVGMGFGGYIDDNFTFAFYWIAHAIPAVGGYTSCTFLVPIARFSETGVACASLAPVAGSIIQVVYIVHAGLYWCYVCNMVAVTYFSFVKPTFKISINPTVALGLLALAEALVFGKLYEIGAFDSSPELPSPKSKLFGLF